MAGPQRVPHLLRLDRQQAVALAELLAMDRTGWRLVTKGVDPAAARALDDEDVAEAFWSELLKRDAEPGDLEQFTTALRAEAGPGIGTSWFLARVLDRAGDTAAAVTMLEAAIDETSTHRAALVDLAGLRADGGDAVGVAVVAASRDHVGRRR